MTGPGHNAPLQEDSPAQQAKTRVCLKCKTPFESAWIGERICGRCKNTGVWKNGVAVNSGRRNAMRRSTPGTADR
jgi:uncharacterized paraquat-inducible protein A